MFVINDSVIIPEGTDDKGLFKGYSIPFARWHYLGGRNSLNYIGKDPAADKLYTIMIKSQQCYALNMK